MTCEEAFNNGVRANRDGKPRSANPHQPSVNEEAFLGWYLGWDEEEGPAYIKADSASPTAS